MLQIENLEVGYGGGAVLRGLNARVEDGQVVCVMGRNGVGKSTMLKSIMGLLRAARGVVSWNENDITRLSDRPARALRHRLRAAGSRDFSADDASRKIC